MTPQPEIPQISLTVGPEEISSYLLRSGWQKEATSRVAEIWTSNGVESATSYDTIEVLVPRVETAPDYDNRVKILLQDLQSFEQRPRDAIWDEMSRQFVDVTDVAAQHELDDSVFPLEASQRLFASAKKMVVAAAAATLKRRGYFGKSVPHRAREKARTILVGHTRPGSYVVPVVSQARLSDASWDDNQPRLVEHIEEASFDRRVVVTLSKALSTLHELAVVNEPAPTARAIHEGVGEGVSYELCDSVIRSLRDSAVDQLTVNFRWAPGIPPGHRSEPGVGFPADSLGRLRRIARGLRRDGEDTEQVIYGWVEVLSSRAEDVGGWVRVHTLIGGFRRIVRMNLDASDYETAVSSHKRHPVIVRGDLHMEAGKLPTMDVHSFEIERRLPGVDG